MQKQQNPIPTFSFRLFTTHHYRPRLRPDRLCRTSKTWSESDPIDRTFSTLDSLPTSPDRFMAFSSASTSTELPWDQQEPLFGSHEGRLDQEEDFEDRPSANPPTDSLYSILNLDKDCTEDEIQKSYKRLAGQSLPPVCILILLLG